MLILIMIWMKKRPKEILNKAQEIIDEKFDELSSLENVKTLNLFVFKRPYGVQMSDKEYDEKYN